MKKAAASAVFLTAAMLSLGDARSAGFAVTARRALAVTADGRLWVAGEGSVNGLRDVVSVAAGTDHVLALQRNGTVWAWGDNTFGQAGSDEPVRVAKPRQVEDLEGIVGIACGDHSSFAWRADGTMWAWGRNERGQLGHSVAEDQRIPDRVRGLPPIVDLSSGPRHSIAVDADGNVWGWGSNAASQIGLGAVAESTAPDRVLDVVGIRRVAAGGAYSLALRFDGTVLSWGQGDGSPRRVPGLQSIVTLAAGAGESLALDASGSVWRWTPGERPARILGVEHAVAVAARGRHLAALTNEGRLWSTESSVSEDAASETPPSARAATANGRTVAAAAAPKTALFVAGAVPLSSADNALNTRFVNLGYTVTQKTGAAAVTADAASKMVVVISSTVNPTDVNTKFRDVAVPVVTWESQIFDDMKMTSTSTSDFGTQTGQTQVAIVTASHPLAGGLSGTVTASTSSTFAWGTPAATAVKVASIVGTAVRSTIFGYESGATMVGQNAPARRVGLFLQDTTSLNASGGTLFDAAIKWASNRAPTANAGTDQTITLPATAALTGTADDDVLPSPPAALTTAWSKVSGPGTVTFGTPSALSTTATFSVAGTYVLRLTASDSQLSTTDDVAVTVNPGNQPPALSAGPDVAVTLPSSAALDGTVTDDGLPTPPAATTVTWSKTSGPGAITFGNANAVDTTATFSVAGTYVLRLTGSDSLLSAFDETTVTVSNPPNMLFVVGNLTLGAGDAAIKTRLQNLGYSPLIKTGPTAAAVDATGMLFVVISSTVTPTDVNTKFRDGAVPVVTWESEIFDDMRMTGTTLNTNFGTQTAQTQVAITAASHFLAAGLTGSVTVSSSSTFAWGLPGTGATKVATIVGNANRATIFAYEPGTTMVGQNAPARRVGLFLQDTTALATNGGALFDAAANWAANRPPLATAGTYSPVTLPSVANLSGTASDDGRPVPPGTLTTTWSKFSGPGTVTFGSASALSTTATFSVSGSYVLRLSASDGQGTTTSDTAITVNPAPVNQAPTASAVTPLTVTLPAAATLDGTVTDDGKPNPPATLTVAWSKVSGPGTVAFGNVTAVDTTATFSLAGSYVLRLTANDSALSTTADVTVTANAPPPNTLFVASSTTLTAADAAVKARLEGLSFTVLVKSATSAVTADANGRLLVVISSTVSPTSVNTKFQTVPVPVVTWESQIFDDMGMTGLASGTDFGTGSSQTTVDILDYEHPLAGGLTGSVVVTTAAGTFNWGAPPAGAAQPVGLGPSSKAVFGYDQGAQMVGTMAPARRVGLFLGDTTAVTLTADGWALFDTAVKWATSTPLAIVATPTFSLTPGAYPAGQTVTISDAGAVIHYTTNGTSPTPSDPVFTLGAPVILGNFTLKARAWQAGRQPSAVASAGYAVTGIFAPGDVAAGIHSLALRPDGTVWAWGPNASGQLGRPGAGSTLPIPVNGLTGVLRIAARLDHSLALRSDGTVWGWGSNGSGQLGFPVASAQAIPAPIIGLSGVAEIAAGGYFTLALKTDGTVWAVGDNAYGELGIGTITPSTVAVQVTGLTDVVAIDAGRFHAVALDNLGRTWVWGRNSEGQVGNGTTDTPQVLPVEVTLTAGAIAAGDSHTLAAGPDGMVWGWGYNASAQAGPSGAYVTFPTEKPMSSVPKTIRVSGGYDHSVILKEDGTVWSWGGNTSGQLGAGPDAYYYLLEPTQAVGPTAAVRIAAGDQHTLALTADGSLWSWGAGTGAVGDGTTIQRSAPVKIAEVGFDWMVGTPQFTPDPAATYHTPPTAFASSATQGATIHYTTEAGHSPDSGDAVWPMAGLPVNPGQPFVARALKAGQPPSNVATANYSIQVEHVSASPPPGVYTAPIQVQLTCPTPGAAISYSTDGGSTWQPYSGAIPISTATQLGVTAALAGWVSAPDVFTYTMQRLDLAPPTITPGTGSSITKVTVELTAISGATIQYTTNGIDPYYGLTYAAPFDLTTTTTLQARAFHPDYVTSDIASANFQILVAPPTFIPGSGTYGMGQAVAVGESTPGATVHYTLNGAEPTEGDPVLSSFALTQNITLKAKAWKTGCTPSTTTTVTYTVSGQATTGSVFATQSSTVAGAVKPDGTLWGWGSNSCGHIGGGAPSNPVLPTAVVGITGVVKAKDGACHAIALRNDGSVWTWGLSGPALGDGTGQGRLTPAPVPGLTGVIAVGAGNGFSLALKSNGTVWSWGENRFGEPTSFSPVQVLQTDGITAFAGVASISVGPNHVLAVKQDGTVWAWGDNGWGQLGTGNQTSQRFPVQVSGLAGVRVVAAGPTHSFALLNDQTVRAWGNNGFGQLGDGTLLPRYLPVPVVGLPQTFDISAGPQHSLAVAVDGSLWSWGQGDLGDASISSRKVPGRVPGLSGIVGAAAGYSHTVALTFDGQVWTFGTYAIGDGTQEKRSTPTQISVSPFIWKTGTPVFSPRPGEYERVETLEVNLSCASPGATIHYTLDGSVPLESSPSAPADGRIVLTQSATLLANAWSAAPPSNSDGGLFAPKALWPSVSPAGNPVLLQYGTAVTAVSADVGAELHYRFEFAAPTELDPLLPPQGVTFPRSGYFSVTATKAGWVPSMTRNQFYTVKAPLPTINPPGATFSSSLTVTLDSPASSVPGSPVLIRYTTDGSTPTVASPAVAPGGTITLDHTVTVRARVMANSLTTGDIATATFFLESETVAAPVMAPIPGPYGAPQNVALSSATPGATIRYTIDGTPPGSRSQAYTGTLAIDGVTTVRAKAFLNGRLPSATTSGTYSVTTSAVATPRLSPPGGGLTRQVTVTEPTPGAAVHYTTNGLDPTEEELALPSGGVIVVDHAIHLRVRAFKAGSTTSPIVSADYAPPGVVAAGGGHSLALRADGTVWAWGANDSGQLGDGTQTMRLSPVLVAGLTDVIAIAARGALSLAVKADGTLWGWGANDCGQLGDGTTTPRNQPIQVSGPVGVVAVAAGACHALALEAGGTVWGWGDNSHGETGNAALGPRQTPALINGLTDVISISAGNQFSLALTTDGSRTTAWSWGSGNSSYGNVSVLGDGTPPTEFRSTPAQIWTGEAVAIAAGLHHALIQKTDGTVLGWGANESGQVGLGNTIPVLLPIQLPGIDSVSLLGVGEQHSVAARQGLAFGWGRNSSAQTGTPLVDPVTTPHSVSILNGVVAVAGGGTHSLAIDDEGVVWAWGANNVGQLGNGTSDEWYVLGHSTPAVVARLRLQGPNWLDEDPDNDGLTTREEPLLGLDPYNSDTNGDGLNDGAALAAGLSATSPDTDGDGLTNAQERILGTDPLRADTDRDGVSDGLDAFPLDPTRWQAPAPNPNDHTPPTITLQEPTNAVLISVVP